MSILTETNKDVKQTSGANSQLNAEVAPQSRKIKAVKTEIYSRVVGYYRPVQDWHLGKQEEFSLRATLSEEEILKSAKYPFPCPNQDQKQA